MRDLGSVQSLHIQPYNYKKWVKNGIKILSDQNSRIIRSGQKKYFPASFVVNYEFGFCTFRGKVRQSGDWKDHIVYRNRRILQSLDIALDTGNIANAVKFKLLIPHTRHGANEIFGTLLLRRLGIIAPNTRLLKVSIAGNSELMLFQEKAAKELLENLSRREGPIFKGDESLLWAYKDRELFELESVSASIMVNDSWAVKGDTSAQISLSAYKQLQSAYARYAHRHKLFGSQISLNPNSSEEGRKRFAVFHLLVLSMNGEHALRPHNRRFYWNSFTSMFEPIYYDGNLRPDVRLDTSLMNRSDLLSIKNEMTLTNVDHVLENIESLIDREFVKEHATLSLQKENIAATDVETMKTAVKTNIRLLDDLVTPITPVAGVDEMGETALDVSDSVKLQAAKNELALGIINIDYSHDKELFEVRCAWGDSCLDTSVNSEELAEMMSSSEFQDRRIMILPKYRGNPIKNASKITRAGEINVSHSAYAVVRYDVAKNTIVLQQKRSNDWFLIANENINDVSIELSGVQETSVSNSQSQRFNTLGLTGCLNFYKVVFDNVSITANAGNCEDSVNVISGSGTINKVEIHKAHSDALDVDFSKITINELLVSEAGNDCLDVSSGDYTIIRSHLADCGDKGVSVGEGSTFHGKQIRVQNASIGISSKDQSLTNIEKLTTSNTRVCAEFGPKKQEFGDSLLKMNDHDCDNNILSTRESAFILAEDTEL